MIEHEHTHPNPDAAALASAVPKTVPEAYAAVTRCVQAEAACRLAYENDKKALAHAAAATVETRQRYRQLEQADRELLGAKPRPRKAKAAPAADAPGEALDDQSADKRQFDNETKGEDA